VSVCEVLHDLPAFEGKDVPLLGRYSYRSTGRWLGEQSCLPAVDGAPTLPLEEETDAPKAPAEYVIDRAVLHRKLAEMQHRTSLGKFRFGTSDYDRWAIVYGRVEKRISDETHKPVLTLIFRGSGVVIFLVGDE
jgi:hypothetical protein